MTKIAAIGSDQGRIIFDNGGGLVLQLGEWAHNYNDYSTDARAAAAAAVDIGSWIAGGDVREWEGHDADAAEDEPTDDEVRNADARVVRLDRGCETVETISQELHRLGCGAMCAALALALGADFHTRE